MLTCILAHFFGASQTHLGSAGSMSHWAANEAFMTDSVATEDIRHRRDDRDRPMDSSQKSPRVSFSSKAEIARCGDDAAAEAFSGKHLNGLGRERWFEKL